MVELLKVALKDKDCIELKRDSKASTVRVPWKKWLVDIVKVVPKLDTLRWTGGGDGEEETRTCEESVPDVQSRTGRRDMGHGAGPACLQRPTSRDDLPP